MNDSEPPWAQINARRIDGVRVVRVIEVSYIVGAGVEGDPVRSCKAYFTLDGACIAEDLQPSALIVQGP